MKLTYNNIDFIRERTYNGKPYGYFVKLKSNRVSDSRDYHTLNEKGRTTKDIEFKFEWLPKTVQRFLLHHAPELDEAFNNMIKDDNNESEKTVFYIYR